MAYNLRYWSESTSDAGFTIRLEILQDGFAGSSEEVEMVDVQITQNDRGIFEPIASKGIEFTLLNTKEQGDFYFKDIVEGPESDHLVRVYRSDDTNTAILFEGIIVDDLYEEEFVDPPYNVTFASNDGLASLENKYADYSSYTVSEDLIRIMDVISACLKETGHETYIYTQNYLKETDMVSALDSHSWLSKTWIHYSSLFASNGEQLTARETLDRILKSFGLKIDRQPRSATEFSWYISRMANFESTQSWTRPVYDADGNLLSAGTSESNHIYPIGGKYHEDQGSSNAFWIDNQTKLSMESGNREIELRLDYQFLDNQVSTEVDNWTPVIDAIDNARIGEWRWDPVDEVNRYTYYSENQSWITPSRVAVLVPKDDYIGVDMRKYGGFTQFRGSFEANRGDILNIEFQVGLFIAGVQVGNTFRVPIYLYFHPDGNGNGGAYVYNDPVNGWILHNPTNISPGIDNRPYYEYATSTGTFDDLHFTATFEIPLDDLNGSNPTQGPFYVPENFTVTWGIYPAWDLSKQGDLDAYGLTFFNSFKVTVTNGDGDVEDNVLIGEISDQYTKRQELDVFYFDTGSYNYKNTLYVDRANTNWTLPNPIPDFIFASEWYETSTPATTQKMQEWMMHDAFKFYNKPRHKFSGNLTWENFIFPLMIESLYMETFMNSKYGAEPWKALYILMNFNWDLLQDTISIKLHEAPEGDINLLN